MNYFSLWFQVLAAAVLGIAAGLFFGPFCNAVQPIGEVYFMLLQMVALPYICIALIHGLGSMTPSLGKKLFKRGWLFWMTLWAIIFIVVYALNLMIPQPMFTTIEVGSNESAKLARSFLSYLVPENPLYDLVNNIVPAIAMFGFIFGLALMHLSSKEPVLSFLGKGTQLVEKILQWLALAAPIGIFTHFSVVFGTVSFEEVTVLFFYVCAFIFAALIITIWILPALLSSLTPLTYGEALKAFKAVCVLPFVTALPTLALPSIILYMKKLGKQHHEGDPHFTATSQTVLPICYCFGQIGNCMILFFILFISFYFRHPFTGWEKAIISLFMLPMSIGTSATTFNVAFLIDQLHFPKQSLEIFKQLSAITLNFQVLISAAGIFTFMVLALYSYYGSLKIKWKRLGIHLAAILIVAGSAITIIRNTVHINDSFQGGYMDLRITDVLDNPVHAKIFQTTPAPLSGENPAGTFERILSTGILKVGYSTIDIPFSYLNYKGELVGYDIAYAYELARDLDCTLEFIPVVFNRMAHQLANGEYDIAMSAVVMDENRIKEMNFSKAYQEQNIVLIVPVNRANEFMDLDSIERNSQLRILGYGYFADVAERHFPNAQHIELETSGGPPMLPLLKGEADVALWTGIEGFAWCLNHPQFVPIDYAGQLGTCYLAYPGSMLANKWIPFLNNWLILKEQSGFKDKMTRFWLKRESVKEPTPRWSIIRNVLHWVD